MSEYTWQEFIQMLEELAAIPCGERWIVPLNPNLSEEERRRLIVMIEYLSGQGKEEDNDE